MRVPSIPIVLAALLLALPAHGVSIRDRWQPAAHVAFTWDGGARISEFSLVANYARRRELAAIGLMAHTFGVEGGGRAIGYGTIAEFAPRLTRDLLRLQVRAGAFYAPQLNAPWSAEDTLPRDAAGFWWMLAGGLGVHLPGGWAGLAVLYEVVPGPLEGGPQLQFNAIF